MNYYAKAIDLKEVCKRFKLVRQKLVMTQTKIAEELGTESV
jgi:DNA-binding XRE family transcriptional regulator